MLRREAFAGSADDAHIGRAALILIDIACCLSAALMLTGRIFGFPIGTIIETVAGMAVSGAAVTARLLNRRRRQPTGCGRGDERPDVSDGFLEPRNWRLDDDRFGAVVGVLLHLVDRIRRNRRCIRRRGTSGIADGIAASPIGGNLEVSV